jgi:hypothetical protein
MNEQHSYPVSILCNLGKVCRAAYYNWLKRGFSINEIKNRRIAVEVLKVHEESPDKGYRRIRDELERYHEIKVNDKRVLRICRILGIKSTIKYASNKLYKACRKSPTYCRKPFE